MLLSLRRARAFSRVMCHLEGHPFFLLLFACRVYSYQRTKNGNANFLWMFSHRQYNTFLHRAHTRTRAHTAGVNMMAKMNTVLAIAMATTAQSEWATLGIVPPLCPYITAYVIRLHKKSPLQYCNALLRRTSHIIGRASGLHLHSSSAVFFCLLPSIFRSLHGSRRSCSVFQPTNLNNPRSSPKAMASMQK